MLLNQFVSFLLNPMTMGLACIGIAWVCLLRHRRGLALSWGGIAFVWFWLWGTPALFRVLGYGLERSYPPLRAETMPCADAIVLLGGGMGASTNMPYAEMWSGADRVWHVARLFRAGRAPVVIPSGTLEERASVPLLVDLGVPRSAIRVESQARNTEENARRVAEMIRGGDVSGTNRTGRVLLVTSAWHMRRALLNFKSAGVTVIPAATDHEATLLCQYPSSCSDWLPSGNYFATNCVMFKEWLGYLLYRVKFGVIGRL